MEQIWNQFISWCNIWVVPYWYYYIGALSVLLLLIILIMIVVSGNSSKTSSYINSDGSKSTIRFNVQKLKNHPHAKFNVQQIHNGYYAGNGKFVNSSKEVKQYKKQVIEHFKNK